MSTEPKPTAPEDNEPVVDLTPLEKKQVHSRTPTRSPVIFEIVRRMGQDELDRPTTSLWWSGLAAGITMGFSLLAEALLKSKLPEFHGVELLVKAGYSLGFIFVILARQQLFTENTLSTVSPVLAQPSRKNLMNLLRVWGLVLAANLTGTFLFALVLSREIVCEPSTLATAVDLSKEAVIRPFLTLLSTGVGAGFLMATLVWILANSREASVAPIFILTYLISIAGFAHVIAGSAEAWLLVLRGEFSLGSAFALYLAPTLIGNVLGGTGLFALLAYGQTKEEFSHQDRAPSRDRMR